jgi:aldose 1-epimerase
LPEVIRIAGGTLAAEIQPGFGGRLLSLYDDCAGRRIDWLVPAPPATGPDAPHIRAGCFPMVPYCNRIRDGQLVFGGRSFDPGARHPWPGAGHGHGFLTAWTIERRTSAELDISFEHEGEDWPSRYRARQRFAISGRTLEIRLEIENIGTAPMPAGIGLHPYFPMPDRLVLAADRHVPVTANFEAEAEAPFTSGPAYEGSPVAPGEVVCLSRWSGRAALSWRGRGTLHLSASAALPFCVLFAPPGADALCIEPCSHVIGGLNPPQPRPGSGVVVLEPGSRFTGSIALECLPSESSG